MHTNAISRKRGVNFASAIQMGHRKWLITI
jgi:hypothetical protein